MKTAFWRAFQPERIPVELTSLGKIVKRSRKPWHATDVKLNQEPNRDNARPEVLEMEKTMPYMKTPDLISFITLKHKFEEKFFLEPCVFNRQTNESDFLKQSTIRYRNLTAKINSAKAEQLSSNTNGKNFNYKVHQSSKMPKSLMKTKHTFEKSQKSVLLKVWSFSKKNLEKHNLLHEQKGSNDSLDRCVVVH